MQNTQLTISSLLLAMFAIGLNMQIIGTFPTTHIGHIETFVRDTKEHATRYLVPAYFSVATVPPDDIIFVGDVLLARNIEYLMERHGENYPYEGLSFTDVSMNSYVVGNFESAIPPLHVPTKPLMMQFSVSEKYIAALQQAGFTHLSLANNHTLDYGDAAFEHTRKSLTSHQLEVFGDPASISPEVSVSYVETADSKVALIGVYAIDRSPSAEAITETFAEAVRQSDFQVVYVHWGTEYSLTSNQHQQHLAEVFVNHGADLVVGHHPHVVQEIGLIAGVPIFYSLGNYIFDQYFSPEVMQGLLINVHFSDEGYINLLPVEQVQLSQPAVMKPRSYQQFLLDLSARSAAPLRDDIQRGIVPLHIRVATSTEIAIMNNNNKS